jgi:hypothetical protein
MNSEPYTVRYYLNIVERAESLNLKTEVHKGCFCLLDAKGVTVCSGENLDRLQAFLDGYQHGLEKEKKREFD